MKAEPLAIASLVAVISIAGCSIEGAISSVDGTGDSVAAETVSPEADATEVPEEVSNLITAVDITSCKIGEYGVEAEGTIMNPSDEISDMWGTIEVTNPAGDRIDEVGAIASAVKPGQKVKFSGSGLEDPADLGTKDITCTVLTVDRFKTE